MRNNNFNCINALSDNQNRTSSAIDANQELAASAQFSFSDANAAGTCKFQGSNSPVNTPLASFIWSNIPNSGIQVGTANITGGASALLYLPQICYRWLRAVYTSTATGAQTIAPVADTGVRQAQTVTSIADTGALEVADVTCVADVAGSLNSTFFTFSAKNSGAGETAYYVWYSNGSGIDPAPGGTPIPVVYVNDDTANTIASLTRAALTSVAGSKITVTGATSHAIITDKFMGNVTNAANGTASPGFSYALTQGASSNLNSTYFLLSSVNLTSKAQKNFYMWFNINSQGVDPLVASKTAVPIAIAAGASANTIATAMRSALNALTNDFVATGANAAVIMTDVAFGPVTTAADSIPAPTGFTFGSATLGVASNLNNTYFYLQDEASTNSYYVWFNVDTIGTDPGPISGRTGAAVAISAGASAATIGAAMASVIAALNGAASFSASGTTLVTITNLVAGPYVPASDGAVPTGFTFAATAGGTGLVTCSYNGLGLS